MNIVIHQPHFLPWIGYFNKLANANIFVIQDNVQFRRRYFQNRTKIRNKETGFFWLTAPVSAKRHTLIRDVIIVENWKQKTLKRIAYTYAHSPFFKEFYDGFSDIIRNSNNRLYELNIDLIKYINAILDINIEIVYASSIKNTPPLPEELAYICQEVNADKYIFGEGGGLMYHGTAVFHKKGIETVQQSFKNKYIPIAKALYPECDNLSILDSLFYLGKDKTEDMVKNLWKI